MNEQNGSFYKINADELIAVAKEEFLPGSQLPADVFLKLHEGKYVLIGRKGTKAAFNDMHFSGKDISTFYVLRTDFRACVSQNLTIAGIVVKSAQVSESKRAEFLGKAADAIYKEIAELGFNKESIEHAKMVVQAIRTLIESKPDLFSVVTLMSQVNGDLIRHSMAVSAISVIIAKNMGWVMPNTIEKIALGGLLHDVGFKELSPELLSKPRHELTFEERQTFETHSFRGMEILRSMPNVPDDMLAIVYEHHENSLGQGYPRKLRDYKMNPLARIVSLADCFVELTVRNVDNPEPRTSEDAVAYIETTLAQPFNKQAFAALKTALGRVAKPSVKMVV